MNQNNEEDIIKLFLNGQGQQLLEEDFNSVVFDKELYNTVSHLDDNFKTLKYICKKLIQLKKNKELKSFIQNNFYSLDFNKKELFECVYKFDNDEALNYLYNNDLNIFKYLYEKKYLDIKIFNYLIKKDYKLNIDFLQLIVNDNKLEYFNSIYYNICSKNLIVDFLLRAKHKTLTTDSIKNSLSQAKTNSPITTFLGNNNEENNILVFSIKKQKINIIKLLLELGEMFNKNNNDCIDNFLYHSVETNNIEIVKLIVNYALYHNIHLNLNKEFYSKTALYKAMYYNNENIAKLLLEYSMKTKHFINFNKEISGDDTIFLFAVYKNNYKIIKLIIEYAITNNIILKINKKDYNNMNALLVATSNNNIEIVKLLIEYADKCSYLDVDAVNEDGNNALLIAILNNSDDLVNILIEYANKYNIILDMNEKNYYKEFPLFASIKNNNTKMVKMIISYSNQFNQLLILNREDIIDSHPLLYAAKNNNIEIVKLLMDYASQHNILLDINCYNRLGFYPLLEAAKNNNTELFKLIIDYSEKYHIILDFNIIPLNVIKENIKEICENYYMYSKYNNMSFIDYLNKNIIECPFYIAFKKENADILNLLINYAIKHDIMIDFKVDHMKKFINKLKNKDIINILLKYLNYFSNNDDIKEQNSSVHSKDKKRKYDEI